MKNLLFALFLVLAISSCTTNQLVNTENQLEISQLNFEEEIISRNDIEIPQIVSSEKFIIVIKPKLQLNKSHKSKRDKGHRISRKSISEIKQINIVDEEPKDAALKKKKKVEIFSIISVILALSSLAIYMIEGATLVFPIVAFALIAAIIGLVRFKQNKEKYFGKGIAILGIIISLFALTFFFLIPDALDFQSMIGWIIIE